MAAWVRTNRTVGANKAAIGSGSSTSGCYIYPYASGLTLSANINANAPLNSAATSSLGLSLASRDDANTVRSYRNGGLIGTKADAPSGGLSLQPITLLARNTTGTSFVEFSDDQIATASVGASLTQSEAAEAYAIDLEFLQAIGAA